MARAKAVLLALAAFAAAGCAGAFKRLAPPGIVKYEELAGDQPVNPAIAEAVAEHQAADADGFPNLSEQPTKVPEGIARPERAAMEKALLESRNSLNEAVAEDKAEAAAERAEPLGVADDAESTSGPPRN